MSKQRSFLQSIDWDNPWYYWQTLSTRIFVCDLDLDSSSFFSERILMFISFNSDPPNNWLTRYLDNNQLTGQIPGSIVLMSQLSGLYVPFILNFLNWCSWILYSFLSLRLIFFWKNSGISNNQLSGTIPAALGKMASLRWMYVSNSLIVDMVGFFLLLTFACSTLNNNLLSGTIPDSIGNLTKLFGLYVLDLINAIGPC